MDKDIQDILMQLLEGQTALTQKIDTLTRGQELILADITEIKEHQAVFEKAVLEQFTALETKLDARIDELTAVTHSNLYDIALLKQKVN